MKKNITYSFLALNLMISTGTCYSSSEFEDPEDRILGAIEEIKKYHTTTTPLSAIKSPEGHIKTKSQKPVNTNHKNNTSQVSILATAIKENSNQKEAVTKKVIRGRDGRKQIQETNLWPHSVHGTVFMTFPSTEPDTYKWGTGTLIAPNLVLTAAHNLYDNVRKEEVTKVRFCPAINGKELYFEEPRVIKHYFLAGYKSSREDDYSLDYGLLVLDQPVGEKTGHFGLSITSEPHLKTKTINVTGYPSDKVRCKDRCYEMWTMADKVTKIQNGIIHYEIDTYGGQSGSGIWYQEGEDYLVPGIHVGGDTHLGINYAVLLTQERYEQITKWVKDSVLHTINKVLHGRSFSNVITLDLSSKYIGDIGAQLFTNDRFPHLKSLNLTNNKIGDAGAAELAKLTNLNTLDLWSNNIGADGAAELAKLTSLNKLNLGYNGIGDAGAAELAKLTNLNRLDSGNNKIGDTGAAELARLTNLKKLNLNDNNIGAAGAKELAKLTNLNTLYLEENNIGDAGAIELTRLTNLTSLSFEENNIGAAGAKELAKLTNLTLLNLSRNNIGAAGAAELAKLTNLTLLDLSYNNIGDAGAAELVKLTNLSFLYLNYNNIGAAGAKELAKLTNLTSLNLDHNNISEEIKEALLSNLRNINMQKANTDVLPSTFGQNILPKCSFL